MLFNCVSAGPVPVAAGADLGSLTNKLDDLQASHMKFEFEEKRRVADHPFHTFPYLFFSIFLYTYQHL